MCGITFIVHSNKSKYRAVKYNKLFEDMLIAGAVRGVDSTGVFQVGRDDRVWFGKQAQPSAIAVSDSHIANIIKDVNNSPINVGHVRAATAGSVTDINAHPFIATKDNGEKDYIIGVHNGTLYGWEHDDVNNEHDVDSSWAFSVLADKGVEGISQFYGAYALVWYDTESPGKLFIARNDERSLHLAVSKDGETIIGASEAGMLSWIAERNDIELAEGEVWSVNSGYLFSIDTNEEKLSVKLEQPLPACGWSTSRTTNTPHAQLPLSPTTYGDIDTIPWPADRVQAPTPVVSYNYGKVKLVEAVKDCLRQARYKPASACADQSSATADDGPIEMGPVERLQHARPEWYDGTVATTDDMRRAMWDGSHGTIVMFESVDYDTFTDSIVGEILSPEVFKRPIAYLTEVAPYEYNQYENKMQPMVVVGLRYFQNEKEYIVVPLNDKGQEALAA